MINIFKKINLFFFGSIWRILFIAFPLISLLVFLGYLYGEYKIAYKMFQEDYQKNMNRILYYYRALNNSIVPSVYQKNIPIKVNVQDVQMRDIGLMTSIYDYHNKKIGVIAKEKRKLVNLNDISPHFINMLILIEDQRFYSHKGVDYRGIIRAIFRNILNMRFIEGGSTITQQLSKLLFTGRRKNFRRKFYEIFISKEIEKYYGKNSLLLMYVNYIHFGHNVYGIEQASNFYLNKSSKDLNLFEASFLVGIIANPTLYSPFRNLQYSKNRHWLILKTIYSHDYIKQDINHLKKEYQQFWKDYDFKKISEDKRSIQLKDRSSYIVEEVKKRVINFFKYEFNGDHDKAYHFLYTQGLKIYTTIDSDLQEEAEKILKNHLDIYRNHLLKMKKINKEDIDNIQGSILAIDPKTGDIKVMVGGYEFNITNQYNRAILSKRQPGSAFKPIFYLAGLEDHVFSPYSLELDTYKNIPLKDGNIWKVKNYNSNYAERPITLSNALKVSSNQVIARLVTKVGLAGTKNILGRILDLDEKTLNELYPEEQYSTVLGTVPVTLLELVQIYMTIANYGLKVPPKFISKIYDLSGDLINISGLNPSKNYEDQIVSKEAAFQIIQMMKKVLSPGGTASWLGKELTNIDLAVKTGTSQGYRDAWFVGLTRNLVTIVWVGHDLNKVLDRGGSSIAGPIFRDFIKFASEKVNLGEFNYDSSFHFHKEYICKVTGLIAVPNKCPAVEEGLFIRNSTTEPSDYCFLTHKESDEALSKKLLSFFKNGYVSNEEYQNADGKEGGDIEKGEEDLSDRKISIEIQKLLN